MTQQAGGCIALVDAADETSGDIWPICFVKLCCSGAFELFYPLLSEGNDKS